MVPNHKAPNYTGRGENNGTFIRGLVVQELLCHWNDKSILRLLSVSLELAISWDELV